MDRRPYLVSTALAGAATHAWLFERTGDPNYRQVAVAALKYLLSEIRPDGSFAGFDQEEPLIQAAYVHEGLIAAEEMLREPDVRQLFDVAMPKHVQWILSQQEQSGFWGRPGGAVALRTPLIVNFLIWYDHHFEHDADIRSAVRRASANLSLERWRREGFFLKGDDGEIYRGIVGRPLAAVVQQRFVAM
jgi:hypothetical protein